MRQGAFACTVGKLVQIGHAGRHTASQVLVEPLGAVASMMVGCSDRTLASWLGHAASVTNACSPARASLSNGLLSSVSSQTLDLRAGRAVENRGLLGPTRAIHVRSHDGIPWTIERQTDADEGVHGSIRCGCGPPRASLTGFWRDRGQTLHGVRTGPHGASQALAG